MLTDRPAQLKRNANTLCVKQKWNENLALSATVIQSAIGAHSSLFVNCNLDKDFKLCHSAIVDILKEEEDLETELAVVDEREDMVQNFDDCLQQLFLQEEPA